ncbi:hypothetical protein BX661DRAFT_183606 [Kickxella alabastrina]|uniref:uncharacterized protein n=1 Tax=Kickxella alabastrina TaxID=61397 RepID=UPI00221E79FD|nr:uncharacterized protein BX661DRAFT_183606 [Kickxella alabastrina]KAI7826844.1 hypothetical protein BX661DRAFT_183606 [Kickxella alabastrina]
MEGNRDEAERALNIAQRKWQGGDVAGALRLARKSHSLFPSETSKSLISQYSNTNSSNGNGNGNGNAAAASAAGVASNDVRAETLRQRKPAASKEEEPSAGRAYTQEQVLAVKKVMAAKSDYYRVLGLAERSATEIEIKKAYRKSALIFHPDKNTAPGADEAFKLVAHAFNILSDNNKRTHYDRFGDGAGVGASDNANSMGGGSGMQQGGRQYYRRSDDEISPEDLFNMFFGGGDLGQFGVQFGPNVRFAQRTNPRHRHHQHQQQQQQANDDDNGFMRACRQLLPILLLVLLFFSSSIIPALFGIVSPPNFAFEQTHQLSKQRQTNSHNVVYWVNPREFAAYEKQSQRDLWGFERDVEAEYISLLQRKCRAERENKRNQVYLAQGWFGMGANPERLKAAEAIQLPACDELRKFK